jgi:UDP-N-acetyl-D-glucosamine dehydrogenase
MSSVLRQHHFQTYDQALLGAIQARTATVAVVGLGYVGMPLLLDTSRAGFPVIGVDVNAERIQSLTAARSYLSDVSDDDVRELRAVSLSSDPLAVSDADVVLIAVPTPLTNGVPDLGMVEGAGQAVATVLRPGMLVVLESTTYPGTTEEVVRPILESTGLVAGDDFFLGYSPERIDPGSGRALADTPKIVSGVGPEATDLVESFYGQLVNEVVRVPSPREAEMAKLIENTFRQVNIALVNEMTMIAPHLGVDIWSALNAAATKPFGYMPFWPGPGVGGHCIAIDPSYLSWRVSERLGFGMGFVEHAKEVNRGMPAHVASRIAVALNTVSKPLRGSRIMAIGAAYKPGVNDVRESPAVAVLQHLMAAGAECSYHDPYVPSLQLGGETLQSVELTPHTLHGQDCVVILTMHPQIDVHALIKSARMVFDARGVTVGLDADNVVRL